MQASTENDTLTFFVWADMHFGYEQKFGPKDIRWQALDQMNRLAGRSYPPEIGGVVEKPEFILVCGDFVSGDPGKEEYFTLYCNALRQTTFPSYEVLGNHEVVHPHVLEYFVEKYGNRYYSFDRKGIHFIGLYQTFDKAEKVEALDDEQLIWLEKELTSLVEGTPVILFAHDALNKQPNAEAIHHVISKANVILILSGHTHGKKLSNGNLHFYSWDGIAGAVTGHVRNHPIDMTYGRTFLVVRITSKDVAALPWRWDLREWAHHQVEGEKSEHIVYNRGKRGSPCSKKQT